ncbi:MAG: DUF1028 domain-containing protein [Anaerolineae bacterium]|nr:DUF1028 domain-containing protein [Anaerolineae bacterium]
MNFHFTQLNSTYSIVARDPQTGQFGVAVQTHQMSVGNGVPWLMPGVGAVATQSLTNVSFGPMALRMLREGVPAEHVIWALVASDEGENRRQVAVVDAKGQAAAHTGKGCIAEAGHYVGDGYSVQANMMTRTTVVKAMATAYELAEGDLAQRMLAALESAQAEDGDIRGMQSSALVVVPADIHEPEWKKDYSLRVDEHENPVMELARLVRNRRAQIIDQQGSDLLAAGQRAEALALWAEARILAPEQEELAFWQAVTLADKTGDIDTAASILKPMLAAEVRREEWIELIRRLANCGLIERQGADAELIAAVR